MDKFYKINIKGYEANLPILTLDNGINVAFFNLHGDAKLTEHCGKELAKFAKDCDVLITAESKGLQLTHVVAREIDKPDYAVARKSMKIYMKDGINVEYGSSIITGDKKAKLYLSKKDEDLLKGKKVGIVDDVISTGESVKALESLVEKAGGIIYKKLFVLAEGKSSERNDICFLAPLPLL